MTVAASTIEIRWRRTDSPGQWQHTTITAGQSSVTLDGVERGASYQIEARSVALSGASSDWVAQTHVVSALSIVPLPPTSLAATSLADGVHLTWAIASAQRTDTEYDVERTPDLSGAPDPSHWVSINSVRTLAYTDGVTDGVVRWYRVRAGTYGGIFSAYTSAISSRGKTVADGATVGGTIGPGGNIGGAVDSNGRAIIDLSQTHLNKILDNVGDGTTFKRLGNVNSDNTLHVSTSLTSQGSVIPQGISNTPFTALSYGDTLNTGSGSKVSWVSAIVYQPDGTTITVPASTDSTQKATVPSPTVSSVAGGAKGARTYFVRIAFLIDGGIRGFSAEVSIAITASHLLKVTSPTATAPWTGYSVFISTSTNTETWESTVSEGGNNNGIPFGTDWTEPTAALTTHGPIFSAINSKGLDGDMHAAVPYNVGAFFYPYWDKDLSLVRMYGDANTGNGLVGGTASTPDNVRGMYLDRHVALAAFGLGFTTITTTQDTSGTTGGGGGLGGCPLEGSTILPLGFHAITHLQENDRWVYIKLQDGRELTATPDHPVYTDRGKMRLSKVKLREEIVTDKGMVKIIEKKFKRFKANKIVVSMVEGHLYYANGILSHNIKLPHS